MVLAADKLGFCDDCMISASFNKISIDAVRANAGEVSAVPALTSGVLVVGGLRDAAAQRSERYDFATADVRSTH